MQRRVQTSRQPAVPQSVEDAGKDFDRVADRFGALDQRPRPRERLDDRRHQPRAVGVARITVSDQPFEVGGQDVVERREAAGLCGRRANPNDRRSSIVELTPVGRKLVEGALKVFEEKLELRIGSVIPEEPVREVTAVLSTLRAAGRALDAERRAAGQTPVPAMRAPKQPGRPGS
ncbi:hypothetical protein [Streptomyces hawaiiensis]|uniref:hypothetical protein n=1 Tax=Streptomyces hawaiiensis TaxID=67305 RepID=UPI0036619B74